MQWCIDMNAEDVIFSLDIGTRTIIGVVGKYKDQKFEILASEIREHDKRNMYDGQIHDINGVVNIVKKVKMSLEEKIGTKLDKVAIAAAGRALKTQRVRLDRDIDFTQEINRNVIESVEMEAIQDAQQLLDKDRKNVDARYYCVGYTVVNYYLDDNFMESVEGHRGRKLGLDLLVTFLPHGVVDSLYTVMNRVNLEVINLTLEPIAAINVAIKKNLRLLNLALVDIGAGTSDIAITKDGTIVAYAMAAVAGDEITEAIAKRYLLDFDMAEKLKVRLNKTNKHQFHDIVGMEYNMTTEEILDSVNEEIENLAEEIANRIIEYNEKSPSAVFLIGGGGQIPRLAPYIAKCLKLPKERVVVRNIDIIQNIDNIPEELTGPNAITPIGIAMMAIDNIHKDFLEVTVNGESIKLFNSRDIKVSDALVLIGYNPRKLISKRGKELIYYINGEMNKVTGEIGEPAKVYVNNKIASLEEKLKNGDLVVIKEATVGKEASISLFDCVDIQGNIIFNDEIVECVKEVKINGQNIDGNVKINMNDKIEIERIDTIEKLFELLQLNIEEFIISREGRLINKDTELRNNDRIVANKSENKTKSLFQKIDLVINEEKRTIIYQKEEFIFVDIFEHIDFDLTKTNGMLRLKVNGENAEYTQKLKDGDQIEIYWEKFN